MTKTNTINLKQNKTHSKFLSMYESPTFFLRSNSFLGFGNRLKSSERFWNKQKSMNRRQ